LSIISAKRNNNINKSLFKSKLSSSDELMGIMEGLSEVMMDKLMSRIEKMNDKDK